jgi:hypothetical protein
VSPRKTCYCAIKRRALRMLPFRLIASAQIPSKSKPSWVSSGPGKSSHFMENMLPTPSIQ